MARTSRTATSALVVLAVLGCMTALYLLRSILIPIALALLLACLFSPVTTAMRRVLKLNATSAAVLLFFLTGLIGLYVISLTTESLIQASETLSSDVKEMAGEMSRRVDDAYRDHPILRGVLPDPHTINVLGDMNAFLIQGLRKSFSDLTYVLIEGFIVLILVLFLLAEGEMLAPKVIRLFTPTVGDLESAERTLKSITHKVRAFLMARTLINLGLGMVLSVSLWLMGVHYALVLGLIAAVTNYVPYVGQIVGGSIPVVLTLGQTGSLGSALLVAAVFTTIVGLEGYVVTPYIMGRSLDLNGTTVLITCLFWGFLWGLVGLILAMPITASIKLILEEIPDMRPWADLMSQERSDPRLERMKADPTIDADRETSRFAAESVEIFPRG